MDTLHAARAARQADAPNNFNLVAVDFYRMGLTDCENRVELGVIVSEIYAFQKRHWRPRPTTDSQFCPSYKNFAPRFALRS